MELRVAGSSLGQTIFFFIIQTAPSSLFNISLVFGYFSLEKALKRLEMLPEFTKLNCRKGVENQFT